MSVLHDTTVTVDVQSAPVIETTVQAIPTITTTVVGIQGVPGVDGIDGANAEGSIFFTFHWGDATPKLLMAIESGSPVMEASVFMIEPMNGIGAALSIGDEDDYSRLMATTENVPTSIGGNTTYPSYEYASDTNIYLSITPGSGCSTGYGIVTLQVKS